MAQTVIINKVVYSEVERVELPLASDPTQKKVFPDTSDATAESAGILDGDTAYVDGEKVTGTMPNIGEQTETIGNKNAKVTIKKGYHDGTGSVGIDATELNKLTSENIKAGVTVMGVEGDPNVVDTSGGDATAGTIMQDKKAYVGGKLVTGTLTTPNISVTDGVLSIA